GPWTPLLSAVNSPAPVRVQHTAVSISPPPSALLAGGKYTHRSVTMTVITGIAVLAFVVSIEGSVG
ncbi:hypothetical protein CHARACLAT_032423, partial [Characodon lateralis]|nr:hypothetical protein [Characodon lateralis]